MVMMETIALGDKEVETKRRGKYRGMLWRVQ